MKTLKHLLLILVVALFVVTSASCDWDSLFVLNKGFGDSDFEQVQGDPEDYDEDGDYTYLENIEGIEYFPGCLNSVFFALYNYYGYEGQHFTNKWLGMVAALNNHGIEVSGYMGEKDAKKFVVTRTDSCDLPSDANIVLVDNQQWDPGKQFNRPFPKYKPIALISTCNGVEFASEPIASSGIGISNATMGGFSPDYAEAMENGTLKYLTAKYACHVLPIVAACVQACDTGSTLRNADNTALSLNVNSWVIQTKDQYNELSVIDSIDPNQPTLRYLNIQKFFDNTNEEYGAANLAKFMEESTSDDLAAIYQGNAANKDADTALVRTGKKLKCGLIAPSSVNDQVRKYMDYIIGYCAEIFNLDIVTFSVTASNDQVVCCQTAVDSGCDFIISLQDDTARNQAISVANENNVWFGICGTCQNPIDYEKVKNLPYYVGSVGNSIVDEYESARQMTEYYLTCMIKRAISLKALVRYQCSVKGIEMPEKPTKEQDGE